MSFGLADPRRRFKAALIAAALLGAVLAAATSIALGQHRHVYALWDHGMMGETDSQGFIISHPALISTDGAHRNSCVAFSVDRNHGTIYCRTDNHNHINTNTLWNYWDQSAHTESQQTSLSHHHHFSPH
jgi:hypothetical protein